MLCGTLTRVVYLTWINFRGDLISRTATFWIFRGDLISRLVGKYWENSHVKEKHILNMKNISITYPDFTNTSTI